MARWESAPLETGKPKWEAAQIDHGVDFTKPVEVVRSAISKLPETDREDALRQWADTFVAAERKNSGIGGAISNTARTLARGTFVGPFLDEANAATAGLMHTATGGAMGAPYDETLAYNRARDRAVDRDYPVASFAGKVAGGIAGGGAALRAGPSAISATVGGPLSFVAPAATAGQRIAQGAGIGAAYGAAQGFGEGEGGIGNRAESAIVGGGVGLALGGAIGSGAEVVRGVRSAAAGQGRTGAYERFRTQLPDGDIDTFANQIATGANRNDQNIQRRTLDILGQEMERAGGDRGQAVQSTVARIVREAGVTETTAREQIRRLTAAQRDSTLLMAEYPAAAEANAAVRGSRNAASVDLQEAGRIRDSGAHMIVDDLANNPGAGSSATVRNAVNDRNVGGRESMLGVIEDLAPRAPGSNRARTIEDLTQMQDGAARAASLEYQRAYNGQTNNNLLVGMLPRVLDRHANRMAGRAGDQAQALQRGLAEFSIDTPNGPALMMTLQQLQDARGALRGQIEVARRAGQDHIVGTLQPLYRDVTRLMERANPTWANANRRWADNSIDTRARELGEAFATKAGPQYRQQLEQYRQLAPEAQQMVQVEYLQKLADKLDNLTDTHDVAKLFTNNHMRNSIRELFGDQGVVAVVQMTRDLGIATRSGRMLGGSQTAMRLARRQDADTETGIRAAAEHASVQGAKSWIIQRLHNLLTERRNRPLAEIATTPVNDTAEVARHIHNMRAAQRYRQSLDAPSPNALLVGAAASGTAAQTTSDYRNR